VTAVPRPTTKLTDEQREKLAAAIEEARKSREARMIADTATEKAWQKILEAREAGVPDEMLCDETGFSRATLNRKFGPKRGSEEA
jgi:hypothetical protein